MTNIKSFVNYFKKVNFKSDWLFTHFFVCDAMLVSLTIALVVDQFHVTYKLCLSFTLRYKKKCNGSISITCLLKAFTHADAMELKLYFINIFTLNFIHYFWLQVHSSFIKYAKKSSLNLRMQKLLFK